MRKGLRWKVVLILAVLAVAVVVSYPITKKIKLGLDLKGGMHLVLQVMTDDAVNQETDQEILRLQDLFKKNSLTYASMARIEPGKLAIQGLNPEQEGKVRDQLDLLRDWDYSLSGPTATATYKTLAIQAIREQAVGQSVETIRNRVDAFGVAEPIIQRQGTSRIIVELPGVDDPDRVQGIIKMTALLEWKLVQAGPAPDEATLLKDLGGAPPDNQEVVAIAPKSRESEGGSFFLLEKVAAVTGADLRTVRRTLDEWNNPAVSFGLKADGARRFESITGQNIGRRLAIILDGKVQSAPVINARISDEGIITGHFTVEQADDLVTVLKAGALPAGLKTLENRTIGPSLGADSVRAGMLAGLIAIVSVMAFMVIYYKLSGFNAVAAMLLNVVILFGSLAYFKATLTLPGIAGIILGLGMSVDANVLIFERIREEHALGKGILSSIALGFQRAFTAIFDSNLTTIISAVFLFQFGTGAIKGYAITLIISLTANLFTAVFVSHVIFDLTHNKNTKTLSI